MVALGDDQYDQRDEPLPDLVIAGDFYAEYDIRNILGKGHSSVVRRCIEKETGVEYAVKIVDLTVEDDNNRADIDELRESTMKEIQIIRACAEQPYIIDLHKTFVTSAYIFIVLDLCRRGELFDYLTDVVSMSQNRTRLIMKQLLEAVEFIHERHIVHRDLKPENILLDEDFNVRLSDFGFACYIESDFELTDLCGTPAYLAPEVLKVSLWDNAPGYGRPVDMWACGVIMYTLLLGRPPFWNLNQTTMLKSIMAGAYSTNQSDWEDIGAPARDLMSRLIIVDASKRLTCKQALNHSFFSLTDLPTTPLPSRSTRHPPYQMSVFYPRRKFKAGILALIAVSRLRAACKHVVHTHITVAQGRDNPYAVRAFRHIIDAGAFKIYHHWVKKGQNQNRQDRAALFEIAPKMDIKNKHIADELAQRTENQPIEMLEAGIRLIVEPPR